MLLHHFCAQLVLFSRRHHRPFGHDDVTIRQPRGEVQALFDQHNGKPAGRLEADDDVFDLIDNGGLSAFRRFIEQQYFRARQDRPSDGELLLFSTT